MTVRRGNTDTVRRLILEFYIGAKERVVRAGFLDEILWQETRSLDSLTESEFLREAAWVVLSAGMAEHVVRRRFPQVSAAFHGWASASEIADDRSNCIARALRTFGHIGKITAIADNCEQVARLGFAQVALEVALGGTATLQRFRFIGPVTSCHLAKNIGLGVAKPDRHLTRISTCVGFESPKELCEAVGEMTGDPVAVVDLVLWRFATLTRDYETQIAVSFPNCRTERSPHSFA